MRQQMLDGSCSAYVRPVSCSLDVRRCIRDLAVIMDDLSRRFCHLPWSFAEIHGDGSVYVCCARYSDGRKIGNIFTDDPMEMWNSDQARAFRAGILDGTFSQCSRVKCPYIAGRELPTKEEAGADGWAEVIASAQTVLDHGPLYVKLAHDETCNLTCPSCRDHIIVAKRARQAELDRVLHRFILPFLKDARSVQLAGDGDPFASRHYRSIMQLTAQGYPDLKISLHTNGVLCDEEAWADCRLDGRAGSVYVSVDAARRETFEVIRRGGDFRRLTANLKFLADKRRRGDIWDLHLLFVVQTGNYKEMPEFVRLGEEFSADSVRFSLIDHWGRAQTHEEYLRHKVWDEGHPEHRAFLNILSDPALDRPIVSLGDVAPLRKALAA